MTDTSENQSPSTAGHPEGVERVNGGQALIRSLELEGVEVIFGLPGGAILPVYDPIIDRRSATSWCVTSRAPATWPRGTPTPRGDPAWPWSRRDLRPPTSSPRCVTPTWIRCRWSASPARWPPASSAPTPSRSATRSASPDRSPSTTSWSPRRPTSPEVVREAFHLATTGRPGPVLFDIPKDIVDPNNPDAWFDWYWPTDDEVWAGLAGLSTHHQGPPPQDPRGRRADRPSERPVIYAGGGILKARAAERCASWPSSARSRW